MKWKGRLLNVITAVIFLSFLVLPAWATSDRLIGEEGYAAQDYTVDDPGDRTYSGGLDIVYSQLATGSSAAKSRCYLKGEDDIWDPSGVIRVRLYDYTGKLVTTVAEVTGLDSATSQGVKLSPDETEVWFSFTCSMGTPYGDGWYKVDADFDTNTFGTPVFQFNQAAAWEMEWCAAGPQAGTQFFAGKDSDPWNDPHAVYVRNGNSWQMVVNVGGYSNGLSFDNEGNLWTGSYTTSGPADQQYIYVFAAAAVDNAVTTQTALTTNDAAQTIMCPSITVGEDTYYTGPNDFECDPDGNVYVTLNGGFDEQANSEAGYVIMLPNKEVGWPTEADIVTLAKTNPTLDWDWMKAMSYDGPNNIDDGGYIDPTQSIVGNCIFVDQDYLFGNGGPDQVTGVTIDDDSDGDGVPDALDNAYQTANAGQEDTDQDMYGNICDADLDNDSDVGITDAGIFRNAYGSNLGDPNWNEDADFDSDGSVGMTDAGTFRNRYEDSAPYY